MPRTSWSQGQGLWTWREAEKECLWFCHLQTVRVSWTPGDYQGLFSTLLLPYDPQLTHSQARSIQFLSASLNCPHKFPRCTYFSPDAKHAGTSSSPGAHTHTHSRAPFILETAITNSICGTVCPWLFFLWLTNRCPSLAPLSDLQMSASRLAPEPVTSQHL